LAPASTEKVLQSSAFIRFVLAIPLPRGIHNLLIQLRLEYILFYFDAIDPKSESILLSIAWLASPLSRVWRSE